jgi:hypothetical protein
MFRYVALIWDVDDSQQLDAALALTRRLKASSSTQWLEALDHPGLRVLCTDVCPGSLEPASCSGRCSHAEPICTTTRRHCDAC